jgi:CHAT domain-containing protein/tetratricopeptide (TPR) repeat protein
LLHWLGLVAYRRGEYAAARRLGERALQRKRELGAARAEIAESQNALGLLAWSEGRLGDAGALLSAARRGFEADGDRVGVAKASNNLGLVALELGRFAEARDGFETARVAARATGNIRVEGRATTNLAMIEIWTGDVNAAPPLLNEARALADSASDPLGSENAIGQLAVAWSALGDPGRALATLDSASEIARRHQLRDEEANNLLVAASIYRDAGDDDRAIQLYTRARAINAELGLAVEEGMVLRHEAMLRGRRGALELARAAATRALAMHRAAGARLEEFHDLLALAHIDGDAGDRDVADRRLAEARRLIPELDAPQIRVSFGLAEASAADRRGDGAAVIAGLRGLAPQLAVSDAAASVDAEWLRTRAFASLGELDSAVAAGRRAVAAVDRARSSFSSPVLRASIVSRRSGVFADVVLALLRVGRQDEAFEIADMSRGRALIDHLSSARDAARRGPTARDLAERDQLLRRIDALLSRLEAVQARPRQERGPEDDAVGRELAERLGQARSDFEAVLVRIAEREPARASLIGARPVRLAAIRGALRPDEVLLQYFVTSERLIVFAVTRDGVVPLDVPISPAQLENRVRLARAIIAAPARGDSAAVVLEDLYRILVAPVAQRRLLDGKRGIVIVPHGILAYLPFAALRNPSTGRRAVDDYTLQFLPTAAALPILRDGRTDGWRGGATVMAPFPQELPGTGEEAAVAAALLPDVRRLAAGAATEAALRQALREGRLVHVATHGIMNPVNPMFSSLRFERGRVGGPDDDGRLEVHELIGMTSASPLVFLSGCETALGGARSTPFDRHEDYATLAQAFLYAGTRAVVATLWRIDDEGAARFAQRFYAHLRSLPAVSALVAAQRDLSRDRRWGHPYYWAGYTISGDGPAMSGANAAAAAVSR